MLNTLTDWFAREYGLIAQRIKKERQHTFTDGHLACAHLYTENNKTKNSYMVKTNIIFTKSSVLNINAAVQISSSWGIWNVRINRNTHPHFCFYRQVYSCACWAVLFCIIKWEWSEVSLMHQGCGKPSSYWQAANKWHFSPSLITCPLLAWVLLTSSINELRQRYIATPCEKRNALLKTDFEGGKNSR